MDRRRALRLGAALVLCLTAASCSQSSTILEAVPPGEPGVPVKPVVLPVAPICLGLNAEQCRDNATTAVESMAGEHTVDDVTRILVRCKGVCTPTKGEGETRIDFDDGSSELTSWGYQTAS